MGFGTFPEVSLAQARKKRDDAKVLLAQDIDPKEQKDDQLREKQLAAGNTFESVATEWFAIKKTKIAETTARSLWRNFENHVFPKLARRPIDKILAPEAISVLKPLAARGSLETTSKLIGYLNEVMRHAVNTGLLHHMKPFVGVTLQEKATDGSIVEFKVFAPRVIVEENDVEKSYTLKFKWLSKLISYIDKKYFSRSDSDLGL